MGNTLTGNTVLLFGDKKDIAPHPVVQLGIDENGLPQPVAVASDGKTQSADMGPGWTAKLGIAGAVISEADISGSATAVTDAPGAGLHLVLTDIIITVAADNVLSFTEETSGTVVLVLAVKAGSSQQFTPRGMLTLPTAAKRLMVQADAAGQVDIMPFYKFQ